MWLFNVRRMAHVFYMQHFLFSIFRFFNRQLVRNMKYTNFETLKSNTDFNRVYAAKRSYANRLLVVYILENGTDANRLGVSVSKKVGNSIVRHRLARLIRESYRLHADEVMTGFDIIVVVRTGLKNKDYFETESALLHLLKMHKLINK